MRHAPRRPAQRYACRHHQRPCDSVLPCRQKTHGAFLNSRIQRFLQGPGIVGLSISDSPIFLRIHHARDTLLHGHFSFARPLFTASLSPRCHAQNGYRYHACRVRFHDSTLHLKPFLLPFPHRRWNAESRPQLPAPCRISPRSATRGARFKSILPEPDTRISSLPVAGPTPDRSGHRHPGCPDRQSSLDSGRIAPPSQSPYSAP